MTKSLPVSFDSFYERIKEILEGARIKLYRTANQEMLQAYWNVGKEIVEEEIKGKERAEYGNYIINNLSARLTQAFGKGFTKSNLNYMRRFYQTFEIGHALRGELSWTHYRLLLKVDNPAYFLVQKDSSSSSVFCFVSGTNRLTKTAATMEIKPYIQ
jgi:hypothetical protein